MSRMCPWTFILKAHPLINLDAEFSFLHDFLDTNARESWNPYRFYNFVILEFTDPWIHKQR